MCGINGFQGNFPRGLIQSMNAAIAHRGPDANGVWQLDNISLGHVRLSIIDISSASNQPFISICGDYILVFNGEIYNFKELRTELLSYGITFSSEGDSEVLLYLWMQCGVKCLDKLDGIFAFAIYQKSTEKLFLVRDNFGVKPLYYSICENGVIFSSEIKAILQDKTISRELDKGAIAAYLTYLWSPGEETVLKSIKKVLPGHYMEFSTGKLVQNKKYYILPTYTGELTLNKSKTYLEESLESSVRSQLVSDVKVGAFLSGGLDSSLICAIAKENAKDFNHVFSIDVNSKKNDGFCDDLPYAKKVATALNLDLSIVKMLPNDISDLPNCIYHLDEPQADPAIINVYKICQLAKKNGVKVLLSGAGGDDLFTGYRRHLAENLQSKFSFLKTPILSILGIVIRFIPKQMAFRRRASKFLSSIQQDDKNRLASYFFWIDPKILSKLFLDYKGDNEIRNELSARLKTPAFNSEIPTTEQLLSIDKQYFLVDHNFNYTDKMSMAHGVEVRVPLVNTDIASVAAKIPTKYKIKGKSCKWILKKVAERWLPKHVIYRSKTGFGAPLREWLMGPLKSVVDEVLSKHSVESRGIFDYLEIQKIIDLDRQGQGDYSYTIYALVTLEIWLRQFIDPVLPQKISLDQIVDIELPSVDEVKYQLERNSA